MSRQNSSRYKDYSDDENYLNTSLSTSSIQSKSSPSRSPQVKTKGNIAPHRTYSSDDSDDQAERRIQTRNLGGRKPSRQITEDDGSPYDNQHQEQQQTRNNIRKPSNNRIGAQSNNNTNAGLFGAPKQSFVPRDINSNRNNGSFRGNNNSNYNSGNESGENNAGWTKTPKKFLDYDDDNHHHHVTQDNNNNNNQQHRRQGSNGTDSSEVRRSGPKRSSAVPMPPPKSQRQTSYNNAGGNDNNDNQAASWATATSFRDYIQSQQPSQSQSQVRNSKDFDNNSNSGHGRTCSRGSYNQYHDDEVQNLSDHDHDHDQVESDSNTVEDFNNPTPDKMKKKTRDNRDNSRRDGGRDSRDGGAAAGSQHQQRAQSAVDHARNDTSGSFTEYVERSNSRPPSQQSSPSRRTQAQRNEGGGQQHNYPPQQQQQRQYQQRPHSQASEGSRGGQTSEMMSRGSRSTFGDEDDEDEDGSQADDDSGGSGHWIVPTQTTNRGDSSGGGNLSLSVPSNNVDKNSLKTNKPNSNNNSNSNYSRSSPSPTPMAPYIANPSFSFVLVAHPRGLRTEHVQCTVRRDRTSMQGKLYPTYEMILEDPRKTLIVARKMNLNRTSNYHLFDMTRGQPGSKLSKKNGNYLGKLRAKNIHRTEYVLLNQSSEREEIAGVLFDRLSLISQLKDGNQPRKMKVLVPSLDGNNIPIPNRTTESDGGSLTEKLIIIDDLEQISAASAGVSNNSGNNNNNNNRNNNNNNNYTDNTNSSNNNNGGDNSSNNSGGGGHNTTTYVSKCGCIAAANAEGMYMYSTKDPVFENGNYRLNFNGRVSMPSVKNYQLVANDDIDNIICQFGKVNEDEFHLDYKAPLNAFQAFAFALCQFNL